MVPVMRKWSPILSWRTSSSVSGGMRRTSRSLILSTGMVLSRAASPLQVRFFQAGAVALDVHADGQGRNVRRVSEDVDLEGSVGAADGLWTDTEGVHLLEDL